MSQFIKQFFGPSWKSVIIKIVLGIILFIAVEIIFAYSNTVVDRYSSGWPLQYATSWGPCPIGGVCHSSNTFALVFDIVFLYLILCLTVFLHKKMKGKTATQ